MTLKIRSLLGVRVGSSLHSGGKPFSQIAYPLEVGYHSAHLRLGVSCAMHDYRQMYVYIDYKQGNRLRSALYEIVEAS